MLHHRRILGRIEGDDRTHDKARLLLEVYHKVEQLEFFTNRMLPVALQVLSMLGFKQFTPNNF